MKSLKLLHTKETIYWTKGRNLLTSVDTKTNLPFYGMTARTKSYVVTVIFLAVFPLESTFWPAQLMFCIYGFQTKIEQLKTTVSLESIGGNISCEGDTKMTSPFRLDTITLYLIRYTLFFWLKIAVRHENLSIKTDCFQVSVCGTRENSDQWILDNTCFSRYPAVQNDVNLT